MNDLEAIVFIALFILGFVALGYAIFFENDPLLAAMYMLPFTIGYTSGNTYIALVAIAFILYLLIPDLLERLK